MCASQNALQQLYLKKWSTHHDLPFWDVTRRLQVGAIQYGQSSLVDIGVIWTDLVQAEGLFTGIHWLKPASVARLML